MRCAAACVCASWRAAVQDSHISSLHLHAINKSDYNHWPVFLQARQSICHVKLTSSLEVVVADDDQCQSSEAREESCFGAWPLVCDSLFLGYPLNAMQPLKFYEVTGLKDLTIQAIYDCYEDHTLPAKPQLQQLTQLTSLTIEVDRFCRNYRATVKNSLYTSPESLRSFSLHILDQDLDEVPSSYSHKLVHCINHIVALELMGCCVVFAKGSVDVSSLHGLQALSLPCSRVYGDHLGISTWTGLTCLNLTDCQWCDLKHSDRLHYFCAAHLASAFSAFIGWPALQVLSVSGCNLFAAHTGLAVAELQQLQVTWLKPYVDSHHLIIHSRGSLPDIATYAGHPLCAEVLVSLYLSVDMPQVTPNLAESIHQLLRCCKALRVLHLISCGQYKGTATLVLDDAEGRCLKELRLDSFKVDILDLSCSAMLTKLQLNRITEENETPIMRLPDGLLSFDCCGSSLFIEHARCELFALN